ncbi:MAG: hypothetical protein QM736_11250 [Vicinamibacterales bacterium]
MPNSALRFRPSNEVFAALGQTPPEPQGRGAGPGGRRGGAEASANGSAPLAQAGPANAPQGAAPSAGVAGDAAKNRTSEAPSARVDVPGTPAGEGSIGRGGFQGGGDAAAGDRRARFSERMQNMTPEEREAAMARMRERGFDPHQSAGRRSRRPQQRPDSHDRASRYRDDAAEGRDWRRDDDRCALRTAAAHGNDRPRMALRWTAN